MIGEIMAGDHYLPGIAIICVAIVILMTTFFREYDDLHRLILTGCSEVVALCIIAFLATDLAEALILPGLVVSLAELVALSEIYINKEGLGLVPAPDRTIEVFSSAPPIIAAILVIYGIVLSGFTGGAVAGVGLLFYYLCLDHKERFALLETVSGYAWVLWVFAFFIFMMLPAYWFFAVMMAGSAIFVKVTIKLALIGTMKPDQLLEETDHV